MEELSEWELLQSYIWAVADQCNLAIEGPIMQRRFGSTSERVSVRDGLGGMCRGLACGIDSLDSAAAPQRRRRFLAQSLRSSSY